MHRRVIAWMGGALLALGLALVAGCGDKVTPPDTPPEQAPETELTFAPIEGDTTSFRIHFYWNGYDRDGEVVRFRYAFDEDADSMNVRDWATTTAKDSTFKFLVDPVKEIKVHTIKVAAEDNDGLIDPTPAVRSFSAKTIPPTSEIEKGPAAFNPIVGPNFTFEWSGIDPDGGETGGRAPVDSFEYLLLLIGSVNEEGHDPLPSYNETFYVGLINQATGPCLPNLGPGQNYSDWCWVGIHALKNRFRNATPGEYVFAIRAVDVAGATEKNLQFGRNIRHFTVSTRNPGPLLTVCSSVFTDCLQPTSGPEDAPRKAIQIFEGETISFSWFANADNYGGEIVGYTFALDDTSFFPGIDLLRTGATFTRAQLEPGNHFLFVRAVDDGGLITNAVIPIRIVHPTFKDPGQPREILYVDDSMAPGNQLVRIGNFPSDAEETDWWTQSLLNTLGVPYTEWDTWSAGFLEGLGRKAPEPVDLANYTTVVWNVDFNNGLGDQATGLFKSLVGGAYSELGGYLRAGGTLILSGFAVAGNTVRPNTALYTNFQRGICFAFEPGTRDYNLSFFPRMMMGVDGALANDQGLRTLGARDFIEAWPTAAGSAMGFDSAFVDRGPLGSGAKWITYPGSGDFNTNRSPGLPQVDGWVLARNFGCSESPNQVFRLEDTNQRIAEAIYRYHGARAGINEEGGASPREGLVAGVRTQAHDLGNQGGGTVNPGNSAGAVGRMVHLAFPLYFLRDDDALNVFQKSFDYVNASPTLP